MPSMLRNKRLSIALIVGMLSAGVVPGLASASPGACDGVLGEAVRYATTQVDEALAGPMDNYGWAHPDDKVATPGQALQYFCFEH